MFPEINYDKIDKVRGLGVSIVTTAKIMKKAENYLSLLECLLRTKSKFGLGRRIVL